jgi:hypothetical protein
VAGLLAAVADTLRGGLLGAVAGQVTDLTAWHVLEWFVCVSRRALTVVALLALGAVTAHVAEATARVAGGLAGTAAVSALALAVAATGTAEATSSVAATLGAVAGNVTLLAALVALLAAGATAHSGATVLGALTADVAGATAAVAGLLSLGRSALTADVTLLAAVVAGRGTLGGALSSAVGVVAACRRVSYCSNESEKRIVAKTRGNRSSGAGGGSGTSLENRRESSWSPELNKANRVFRCRLSDFSSSAATGGVGFCDVRGRRRVESAPIEQNRNSYSCSSHGHRRQEQEPGNPL